MYAADSKHLLTEIQPNNNMTNYTHTVTLDPIKATADTHLLNLVSKLTCKHILLTHTDHLIAHVYVCSPLFNLFSRLDLQTQ